MSNPLRLWAPAMAVLVLFATLSFPLANALHLVGAKLWLVRGALWVFGAIAAARKPFSGLENINLHKSGRKVVLETGGVPVFDEKGEFHGVIQRRARMARNEIGD